MSAGELMKKAVPYINVTPLIDVLLVLLIIFMVVTPMKPSRFKALIPEPPKPTQDPPEGDKLTLVVTIKQDGALELNKIGEMGSVNDTGKLSATQSELFQRRIESHAYRYDLKDRIDLPDEQRIQRTVFIKAPRSIAYGEVAKVIDGIRGAGAEPVGLQIDELD
jgi:biopolymer transport protein ExbD